MRTKRWLESTTHLELEFDVYDWLPECTVSCLDGSLQSFDLKGRIFRSKSPLFVENKAVKNVGHQPSQFMDFLAIAYSATAAEIKRTQDPKWQFMWVTTHPFSQTDWPKLTKRARIMQALAQDTTGILKDEQISDDIVDLLVERIWLLVLNKRQQELTLSRKELNRIEAILNRKGRP
jgi:hypothetical protein